MWCQNTSQSTKHHGTCMESISRGYFPNHRTNISHRKYMFANVPWCWKIITCSLEHLCLICVLRIKIRWFSMRLLPLIIQYLQLLGWLVTVVIRMIIFASQGVPFTLLNSNPWQYYSTVDSSKAPPPHPFR